MTSKHVNTNNITSPAMRMLSRSEQEMRKATTLEHNNALELGPFVANASFPAFKTHNDDRTAATTWVMEDGRTKHKHNDGVKEIDNTLDGGWLMTMDGRIAADVAANDHGSSLDMPTNKDASPERDIWEYWGPGTYTKEGSSSASTPTVNKVITLESKEMAWLHEMDEMLAAKAATRVTEVVGNDSDEEGGPGSGLGPGSGSGPVADDTTFFRLGLVKKIATAPALGKRARGGDGMPVPPAKATTAPATRSRIHADRDYLIPARGQGEQNLRERPPIPSTIHWQPVVMATTAKQVAQTTTAKQVAQTTTAKQVAQTTTAKQIGLASYDFGQLDGSPDQYFGSARMAGPLPSLPTSAPRSAQRKK